MNPRTSAAIHLAASFLSVVVALSFGFSYGNVGNQATYLPHALHHLHPAFLANDWLVCDTTPYHDRFEWIVSLILHVAPLSWGSAIFNLVLTSADIYLIYLIVRYLVPKAAISAFIFMVLFMVVELTRTVGSAYLLSDGLQPSALATLAWLAAILLFLRGYVAGSGVLLAVGGLFHANFLLLGIGMFFVVQLSEGREGLRRRLCMQLVPSLVVLAFLLPSIIATVSGPHAADARDIFQRIRSPYHYLPQTFLPDFWQWGGWMLTGIGASLSMRETKQKRQLLALLGSIAVSVVGATLLTTLVFIPAVSQLFVWRLAPFGVLLSQIALVGFFYNPADKDFVDAPRHRGWYVGMMAVGGMCIVRWYLYSFDTLSLPTLSLGCVLLLFSAIACCRRYATMEMASYLRRAGACTAFALTLPMLMNRLEIMVEKSTLFHPQKFPLYNWALTSPIGSRFLIPPEVGEFRLLGERAIVVDWKSTPIRPDELLAWRGRIEMEAGRAIGGLNDAVIGYRCRSLEQLRKVAQEFGANYIVVDRNKHSGDLGNSVPIYLTSQFAIYEVKLTDTPNSTHVRLRSDSFVL